MIYSCIVSTYLPICKVACCTTSEDICSQWMSLLPCLCCAIGGPSGLVSRVLNHDFDYASYANSALIFPFLPLLSTNTWLENCSVVFWAFRMLEEEFRRQLQPSVFCSVSWEGASGSPSLFPGRCLGHKENPGFVQISAQLFTNCGPWANFTTSSKLAFGSLWFCIKKPPHIPLWKTGSSLFSDLPLFSLPSLVASGSGQRAFPLLLPQRHFCSLSSQTLLLPLSPVLVPGFQSENGVTVVWG